MIPKVEVLRLRGLSMEDGLQAAQALLRDRSIPDLSRLIVVDDVAALADRSGTFTCLLTSGRMKRLLCVVMGARAQAGRGITLPGSIAPGQGSPVLWVGDQLGVDWPLSASGIPVFRTEAGPDGLERLIEVLSGHEVFDQVCTVAGQIPGGVASPGLRLAGADAERPAFAAAFSRAIRQLTAPADRAPGDAKPYSTPESGPVSLAAQSPISRAAGEVGAVTDEATAALGRMARAGGLFRAEKPAVREQIQAAGQQLWHLRDLVAGLFADAQAPGGPTERELRHVRAAGVVLSGPPPAGGQPLAVPSASGAVARLQLGTIARDVADSLLNGESLPQAAERLAMTERELRPRGSRAYLPELDACCPPALLDRFIDPPMVPPPSAWLPAAGALAAAIAAAASPIAGLTMVLAWSGLVALAERRASAPAQAMRRQVVVNLVSALAGGVVGAAAGLAARLPAPAAVGGVVLAVLISLAFAVQSWRIRVRDWRDALAPEDAPSAAERLTTLVIKVAAQEWAASRARLEEVTRARIVIEAVTGQLAERARHSGAEQAAERRAIRLCESLLPVLRDLVIAVLAAAAASGDGQATFERARGKTAELMESWAAHAQEHGPLSPPPFAAGAKHGAEYHGDGDVEQLVAAATADPAAVMWQLCAPSDVSALDVSARPQVIIFAPQVTRDAAAGALPVGTVWTASGERGGLLRLVPLRDGLVQVSWSSRAPREEPW